MKLKLIGGPYGGCTLEAGEIRPGDVLHIETPNAPELDCYHDVQENGTATHRLARPARGERPVLFFSANELET